MRHNVIITFNLPSIDVSPYSGLALLGLAAWAGITVSMLRSEKLMTWSQGRSMVFSQRGIVAAEQPLASEAGATILAQGGSAADAAIATISYDPATAFKTALTPAATPNARNPVTDDPAKDAQNGDAGDKPS